ncbi:hypothetical protein [Methylobacterium sp. E-046]|uniref:hypothetical protein n=1 Tax=Methylobacterium sp. E-046 TaxID=2836576 RepID=UPI001FBB4588|nr:hypothetical protein [Methylobacterium sp. E-046]MCJ2102702.1 hypothetical protein [Methylobacterium sp. E-046]
MRIEPEIGGVAVVLLGNFNPAIFSPQWFARREIVSEAEADEAQIGVIHPEVVMFRLGSKNIHVEQNRFQVDTNEAPWVTALDVVAKTFGEFLVYTPVTSFGINRQVHFRLKSEPARFALGRKLAPTTPWGDWGQELDERPKELRSGVIDLTMREVWKNEVLNGYTQATVQPSNILPGNTGVYIRINDHSNINVPQDGEGAERIIQTLCDKFDDVINRAEWIIDQIMKIAEEE